MASDIIARGMAAKAFPKVNVKSFGAKGDNANDDTALLQAAIDSVSTGGTIYVPPGTYKITSSLKLYSNQSLELSPVATILRSSNMDNMVRNYTDGTLGAYDASNNITITGGTFDANRTNYPTYCTMVGIGHAKYITISDVSFKNSQDWHMIELNATKFGKITRCRFDNYGSASVGTEMIQLDFMKSSTEFPWFGPYDNTSCEDITIEGCTFTNGVTAIGGHTKVDGVSHKRIHILNNHFDGMLKDTVILCNWEYVTIQGNTFFNVFKGVTSNILSTNRLKNIVISNNQFIYTLADVNSRAINLTSSGTNIYEQVMIEGNYVQGSKHGIGFDFCENVIVENNLVTGCQQAGIWSYGAKNVVISNNIATGNNTTATASRYDLMVGYTGIATDSKDTTVTDNIATTLGLQQITGGVVTNNQIKSGTAISNLVSLTNVTMYGNWFTAATAFDNDLIGASGTATVAAAGTSIAVTFTKTRPNTNYSIAIVPSWGTTFWYTNKTTTGFTINVGTAPAGASPVEWTATQYA